MDLLLSAAVALVAGLLFTRLTSKLGLPDVTAYLLAGVLIGPYCLGRLQVPGLGFSSTAQVEALTFLQNLALGFIAFTIGNEFRLSQLRHTGRQALVIGIMEGIVSALVVDGALLLFLPLLGGVLTPAGCITMGAIAAATAPAATLMVVRQFKAKGPVVDVLLPVVALDDAVGLAVFAVSFGIAQAVSSGAMNVFTTLAVPLLTIVLSLAGGAGMGFLLTWVERFFHSNTNRMSLIVGFVLLTVALSLQVLPLGGVSLSFSTLLVCMALGAVFCNTCPLSEDLMDKCSKWTSPLFALFFVLCGAQLELSVFSSLTVVAVGLVYIVFRCAGKYLGAWVSCTLVKTSRPVRRWLGVTLFPQAGVALGMCVTVSSWGEQGALIRNIILFGVLIYELFGPILTKMALTRAGDIQPMSPEVASRRQTMLQARGR